MPDDAAAGTAELEGVSGGAAAVGGRIAAAGMSGRTDASATVPPDAMQIAAASAATRIEPVPTGIANRARGIGRLAGMRRHLRRKAAARVRRGTATGYPIPGCERVRWAV